MYCGNGQPFISNKKLTKEKVMKKIPAQKIKKRIRDFLTESIFPDVGLVTASNVVGTFGIHTPRVIETTPEKLRAVHGVGPKRQRSIIDGWHLQRHLISQTTALLEIADQEK